MEDNGLEPTVALPEKTLATVKGSAGTDAYMMQKGFEWGRIRELIAACPDMSPEVRIALVAQGDRLIGVASHGCRTGASHCRG